jgi:hypothetical protein
MSRFRDFVQSRLVTHLDQIDPKTKLAAMKEVAATKVARANGASGFWQEVEANLETIALAKLAKMAPISENLLGIALMLSAEVKRLRG